MRHIYIIITLLVVHNFVFAQNNIELQRAKEMLAQKGAVEIKVKNNNNQLLKEIAANFPIDNLDNGFINLYLTESEFYQFANLYNNYEVFIPDNIYSKTNTMTSSVTELMEDWDKYPTYETYIAFMEKMETDYPDLCKLIDFGESVNGRSLLTLKISDNVETDEAEPELFYSSTMHGDETTCYMLMLRLIDYLLSNYSTDDNVKEMVDNIEIFINPVSNPDGTYKGGNNIISYSTSSRYNANNKDLNRNYTPPGEVESPDNWEPENVAMIDFMKAHDFNLSINFHTGAEVINYPWDYWSRLHADDDWWQFVSREYADTAQYYSPDGYLNDLNNGITNGYDWYYVSGSRQDYVVYFLHRREVTAEVSSTKLPDSDKMPNYWNYNKNALLNFINQSRYGVQGFVTDITTGNPIEAKVEIADHELDNSEVYSQATFGYYCRFINAGTYDLTFTNESSSDYVTVKNVLVNNYELTKLNVTIPSCGLVGNVLIEDTGEPIVAKIEAVSAKSKTTIYSNEDGSFQLLLDEGTYNVTISYGVYDTIYDSNITITANQLFYKIYLLNPENDAPQIVNSEGVPIDTLYISAEANTNLLVSINTSDSNNDNVVVTNSYSITENSTVYFGSTVHINPNEDFVGNELVSVVVSDDGSPVMRDTAIIKVTFTLPANNAPIITNDLGTPVDTLYYTINNNESTEIRIFAYDTDDDLIDISQVISLSNNAEYSLSTSGDTTFTVFPNEEFVGEESCKVFVIDNGQPAMQDSVIVVITIQEVEENTPPTFTNEAGNIIDSLYISVVKDSFVTKNYYVNDSESESLEMSLIYCESGEVSLLDNQSFIYTPEDGFFGNDGFEIIATDEGSLSDTLFVCVTVYELGNHHPEIIDINGNTIDTLRVMLSNTDLFNLKLNVRDVDNDTVDICQAYSFNTDAIISLLPVGDTSFSYQPIEDFYATDTVFVKVCESSFYNLSDSVIILFTYPENVNHAPTIVDIYGNEIQELSLGMYKDSVAYICIYAQDVDDDSVYISSITRIDSFGIVVLNHEQPLCFNYYAKNTGIDELKVVVCDDDTEPLCDTIIIYITIEQYVGVSMFDNETIEVYPNPFDEIIHLSISNVINSVYCVELFNILGRQVYKTKSLDSKIIDIPTNDIKSGLYFLKISSSESLIMKKIIKK